MRGADANNLQDVDVDIPLGVLVVVTGVAGSGKSSLIDGSVSGRDGVVSVDQGANRSWSRSNPATYTGLLDPIRKAFAKANGVKPALFSANSREPAPPATGPGHYTDLGFMATVESTCEECEGKPFQASVLEYSLGGRNIAEVLAMSVTWRGSSSTGEARPPAAHAIVGRWRSWGSASPTRPPLAALSGRERHRLKLATQMAGKGGVYVLDEPTSGLHLADVERLLGLLDRLVDSGRSVIVIEHHRAVLRTPTGSSTWVPAPATTAAGSSSRARPPISSPTAPPSPASTSRPTSAPDRGFGEDLGVSSPHFPSVSPITFIMSPYPEGHLPSPDCLSRGSQPFGPSGRSFPRLKLPVTQAGVLCRSPRRSPGTR